MEIYAAIIVNSSKFNSVGVVLEYMIRTKKPSAPIVLIITKIQSAGMESFV
jgi:hypothetical protein